MPDDKPPADDAFAQLFGRLPDPRARAASGNGAPGSLPPVPPIPADEAAGRTGGAAASGAALNTTGAPLSRREMRELAARNGAVPAAQAAGPASAKTVPADSVSSGPVPTRPVRPDPVPADLAATDPVRSNPVASDPTTADPRPTDTAAPEPVLFPGPREAPAAADLAHPAITRPRAPEPTASLESVESAATMTLDELFADGKQATPTKTEKRRNRRLGGWIALGVVLVLVGGLAAAGAWAWNTHERPIRALLGWEEPRDFEAGLANGEAIVTISSGDGGQAISQTLHDAGVTKTPDAFYSWLIGLDSVPTFYPGVYRLQLQMTSAAALDALQNPASKLENSAQIREGLTVDQTLPLLAEGIGLPIEDFQAAVGDPAAFGVAAQSLEGWLFPATYTFDPGVTAPQVIQVMVDRSIQSLDAAGVPVEERQRILTIASIIQREARSAEDFYRVSRVIVNRLDPGNQETNGLLQMDSTAQYGYGELHDGTVSSSGEALAHDNPWNTYVYPGLPVGPIANPGDTAIDAATNPAEGPWLYFVTVNLETGETVFTETNAQHQQAVAQWQQWCRENPDSGC